MQEYISQQHRVLLPAEQIYAVISRFDNLTPALADRVEEWQADEERCSFKAKGFTVKLRMEERIELNMMMKMMIGGKLQKAVDQIAEGIANALNGVRPA